MDLQHIYKCKGTFVGHSVSTSVEKILCVKYSNVCI